MEIGGLRLEMDDILAELVAVVVLSAVLVWYIRRVYDMSRCFEECEGVPHHITSEGSRKVRRNVIVYKYEVNGKSYFATGDKYYVTHKKATEHMDYNVVVKYNKNKPKVGCIGNKLEHYKRYLGMVTLLWLFAMFVTTATCVMELL